MVTNTNWFTWTGFDTQNNIQQGVWPQDNIISWDDFYSNAKTLKEKYGTPIKDTLKYVEESGKKVDKANEFRRNIAKENVKQFASDQFSLWGTLAWAWALWLWIASLQPKTKAVSPRLAKEIIRPQDDSLPIKRPLEIIKWWIKTEKTILRDIFDVPSSYFKDTTPIVEEFLWNVKKRDNLKDMQYDLKQTSIPIIEKRNKLIDKYNRVHSRDELTEMLYWIVDYQDELKNTPWDTSSQIKKVQKVIDEEVRWINEQWAGINTKTIEKRKELLNERLKKFFDKDASQLTVNQKAEEQALNRLRQWYQRAVEIAAWWSEEINQIKELNKRYGVFADMDNLLERRIIKTRKVEPASRFKRILSSSKESIASIPSRFSITQRILPQITRDEEILGKIPKITRDIEKFADRAWYKVLKWWSKLARVAEPIGAVELAEMIPWSIWEAAKWFFEQVPAGIAFKRIFWENDPKQMIADDLWIPVWMWEVTADRAITSAAKVALPWKPKEWAEPKEVITVDDLIEKSWGDIDKLRDEIQWFIEINNIPVTDLSPEVRNMLGII